MKIKLEVVKAIILSSIAGGSMISCAHSPDWVKTQKDKVKVSLVTPTAYESKHDNLNGLTVLMSVEEDSMSSGSGIPISHSGGGTLGTKLQINRPDISYKQASFNVDHCIGKAAEQGVIQSFSSGPSGQDGFSSEYKSQSIEPFVDRFTGCLKAFGYSVQ